MNSLPGPSISLDEAVQCIDCRCIFSSRSGSCPRCAAVLGIVPVETTAPAREIARLRDREAWCTAALLQIAHGSHSRFFKSHLAKRTLAMLAEEDTRIKFKSLKDHKTETAPESPDAAIQKGNVN